jgi:2-phospho-L-lactate guanylyltransferase
MLLRPVWAVVPAKSFATGKSRLSSVLAGPERARFAGELLDHTLSVLGTAGLDGVLVATDGDDVAELARQHGAHVLRDDGSAPPPVPSTGEARSGPRLAAVVDGALAEVEARGAKTALVLMADLPRIEVGDVAQLLGAVAAGTVVLAADHLGRHTNALAMSPPTLIETCFGRADSFAAHRAAVEAAGFEVAVVENERVAFDVDAPADHARLGAASIP